MKPDGNELVEMRLIVDDLSDPRVLDFLAAHVRQMQESSPPESVHVFDLDKLRRPEVTVWTMWADKYGPDGPDTEVAGCVALTDLGHGHGEIKSMRTAPERRGQGLAHRLMDNVLAAAKELGWRRLSLETGAGELWAPARGLYAAYGFVECPPFGDYGPDPLSVFMTRKIG